MDYEKKCNKDITMTTEEKAKAYDEALERARKSLRAAGDVGTSIVTYIFPQLAESEDERIRKAIVATIEQCPYDFLNPKNRDKMLAYLEKQKEQIPYTDFVIRPHKGDDNNPYDMGVSEAQEYAIKRGFGVPFIDGEVYVDERHIIQTVGNIIRWADEHPKEQKPAEWSEEDEEVMEDLYNFVISDFIQSHIHETRWKPWKTTLERNRQNRLKSLRPQYHGDVTMTEAYKMGLEAGKASSWEPSEEQMRGLAHAINIDVYDAQRYKLDTLYYDLKKLM